MMGPRSPRNLGFTLLEIIVAMGIFVILGAALITILRQGLDLWREGEARKETYERANFILSYIREDLINTYSGSGEPNPVRFLCDLEPASVERGVQRQRLRFVRTRKGESQHPVGGQGGMIIESTDYYDHFGDVSEMREGTLRAGAGLEEVIYLLDPDPEETTLWRGIRSPPGGEGSFLDPMGLRKLYVEDHCQPLATGVLYLEFRFWTQFTRTWDDGFYPRLYPHDEETRSGPALIWDSTRGLFPPEAGIGKGDFRVVLGPESLYDTADDIFPRQVMVVLVMEAATPVTLAQGISKDSTRIPLVGSSRIPGAAPRYVRIDREWIGYDTIEKGRLILGDAGRQRGARWTRPASHRKGAEVQVGRTFTLVVRIPAYRDDWNYRDR